MNPEQLPILYSFRRCPYAMRARLALATSGLPYELREVVLRNKPPEMIAASPKATVPVLVLPTGEVIDQSLDIMLWALRQNDPQGWLMPQNSTLAVMLAIITTNDGPFKTSLDRYKYPNRYTQEYVVADSAKFAETHRTSCAKFLNQLETLLSQSAGAKNLFGDKTSLADMATLPFIRQFAHTDKNWFAEQPWPNLQLWLAQFEASDLFVRVMEKNEPWRGFSVSN